MKLTNEQLQERLAANPDLLRRNPSLAGSLSSPKPEPSIRNEPLAKAPRTNEHSPRYALRIISHRVRLIDPDNLCAKAFVDGLRHAGLIPDDSAAILDYRVEQQKAKTKKEQFTEIELKRLT